MCKKFSSISRLNIPGLVELVVLFKFFTDYYLTFCFHKVFHQLLFGVFMHGGSYIHGLCKIKDGWDECILSNRWLETSKCANLKRELLCQICRMNLLFREKLSKTYQVVCGWLFAPSPKVVVIASTSRHLNGWTCSGESHLTNVLPKFFFSWRRPLVSTYDRN